ncbi:hemin uptake protein HemP [Pontivivens ytuae]|uniref:Hemin uptake protein HemP n=1 Tax=Pontivivens ytuae TaxID=2789856 RepID=A0A7S9QCF8_9RHOB|nr:hemin uptake protein HemP [Pontivivens ytuae]QPH54168.1 hemin uptake protein HemP [Pontivivens ytuae]
MTRPQPEQEEARPPTYDAHELTGRQGSAFIELDGKVYTLRITRQNKLILTK